MAHRGRLNTLVCVFKKSKVSIFSEFEYKIPKIDEEYIYNFSGDVKYHVGVNKKI